MKVPDEILELASPKAQEALKGVCKELKKLSSDILTEFVFRSHIAIVTQEVEKEKGVISPDEFVFLVISAIKTTAAVSKRDFDHWILYGEHDEPYNTRTH